MHHLPPSQRHHSLDRCWHDAFCPGGRPLPLPLQVRASIQAAQASEAARVQADIQRFCDSVEQYLTGIYAKRSFFAWATGVEAAFADIDKVGAAEAAMCGSC